jgi:type II secretory pathway component PulM
MMQISKRERWLAIGLTVAVALWALYALAIRPACDRLRVLGRVVPARQAQLQDLQAKIAQYTALRDEFAQARAQMTAQEPDFDITRFLEGMIDQHKLARHVVTMSPDTVQPRPDYSETVVTIELHDISLKELVYFLTDVESSASLARIGALHIRTDPKSETQLDSTVGICSPKLGPSALATQTSP